MLKLLLALTVLSLSGCGLIMLPMLCDAPDACGNKWYEDEAKYQENAYGPCGWEGEDCRNGDVNANINQISR